MAIIHNPGALIKELEEVDQLEDSLIELDTIIQSQEFARPPIPDGPNGMELMSHSEESSQMVDLDHEAELDRLSAEFIENMAENADEDELLTYNGDPTSNSVSLASDKGPEPTNVISIGSDVELEVPSPAQTPKKSPKKSSPKKIRYEFDIEKQS